MRKLLACGRSQTDVIQKIIDDLADFGIAGGEFVELDRLGDDVLTRIRALSEE
jgi:hypothetical protein